jgi:DNA polymerase III subunit delta
MGRSRHAGARRVTEQPPPQLAYFWGQDAFALEDAARKLAAQLSAAAGAPVDVWRTSGEQPNTLDEIERRISSGTLFGAGTLVVVREPGTLLREASSRERLIGLLAHVAPGNALCFVDLVAAGGKGPAQAGALRDAIAANRGLVSEFPALTRERMEGWLNSRATELGTSFVPGAGRLLAERVGAYVRENDVDRRRQSELANAELEKLALYRPAGTITRDDVEELVTEAVPGSTWALLDAIGSRRASEAAMLTQRLLAAGTPLPVLISQLHRRLRELIVIADHLAAGTKPAELVAELRLQPFRAQKLTQQARAWRPAELDDVLGGLLDIDLLSKGIAADGSPRSLSDDRSALALLAWIGERVGAGARAAAQR